MSEPQKQPNQNTTGNASHDIAGSTTAAAVQADSAGASAIDTAAIKNLVQKAEHLGPREAIDLLKPHDLPTIAAVLLSLNPIVTEPILDELSDSVRDTWLNALPEDVARQWRFNLTFPDKSLGRLMEHPKAIYSPQTTVAQTVEYLRELVRHAFITYVYVTDEQGKLLGLVVMRELMLAKPDQTLADIMITKPFALKPQMSQIEAMRSVLTRHFPVYPVCNDEGVLIGLIRGATLFEKQAVELTSQAGSMVGVEKEERVATPWPVSLKFRQPWLQINLLTAFVAAAVVGSFQETIDRVVVLAAFLPVLAGQSGNTGCQAMAVSLRAMTLGELKSGGEKIIMIKEALLGLLNGVLTGLTAAAGMYCYARYQGNPEAYALAVVVILAMTGSCVISGVFGVIVPVALKKFGFDPATASSIFLTTVTDVVSMGLLLGLASVMV